MSSARGIAALLTLVLFGSACTDGERPGPGPVPDEDRPPPRGVVRMGYPEEPPSLDPRRATAPAATDILRAVLPSFFLVTPALKYRPYLLAGEPRVAVEGDRMVVTFRIREEASWTDGRPITVNDVAFTSRTMSDANVPHTLRFGFDRVVRVEEISPNSGRLVLSPPFAAWRDLFSAGRFVLPAHARDEDWSEGPPVAGGPFRIRRWTRGRAVELAANRDFFGPSPLLEGIEVTFVPDATTAVQLLRTGLLDAVAPMLGISWSRRLERLPGVRVSEAFGADLVYLLIDADAVGGAAARRRIADGVNRDRFVEAVVRDEGRSVDGALAPEIAGAAPAWSGYGTPPAKRIRDDEELTLVYAASELMDLAARFVRAELERAGADVELLSLDADVFQATRLPTRRYDLALWEARSGPRQWLSRWFAVRKTGLDDGRLKRLFLNVDRGGPAGLEALGAAQERLADLAPVLPLFQPVVAMGWRTGITGLRANPSVDGPLWNAWAWAKMSA